jgi:alkylation response protein AidB-like acyl-CoA dehydrogenase
VDFSFTEEQEKLRKEVHDFFMNELPSDYRPGLSGRRASSEKQFEFWMQLQKKAGAKGYLTPGWAKDSGGLGLSDIEQGIVMEETGYWGASWPGNMGLRVCGPPLHVFGTEEQKKKFLPPIASGEAIWYEAFTEPDAGSDEANVSLRCMPDGDYFIFNGQKHFMTAPGPADYLYTLARTADSTPKHRGLSLFLIDAHTPGISYRPMPTLGNFTVEIFFDNVRVHKVTFEFERTNTGTPAMARRSLEELIQFAKEEKRNGKQLIEDDEMREVLADRAIEYVLAWLGGWRDAWFFSQRRRLGSPPPSTSAFRGKTEAAPRAKAFVDSLGLYGQLQRNSKYAKFAGQGERGWLSSRSMHPAGTIEVNKIVLAGRGLGLPRIPAKFNKEIAKAITEKD